MTITAQQSNHAEDTVLVNTDPVTKADDTNSANGAIAKEGTTTARDDVGGTEPAHAPRVVRTGRVLARISWIRVLAYGILPALALLLALGAGLLKFQSSSARDDDRARIESVRAATDSTIALLSYQPDTVAKDLGAARDRLTGNFRDAYTALTHDVVIPGSQQKHISAAAKVAAAASVSASPTRAVVLVFIDQTISIGTDSPTDTASTVKVTLDKIGSRWLISDFTPV